MRTLYGRWFLTIDGSRRVSFPQALLRLLDERGISSFMIGTPSRLRCAWLIPTSEWPEAEAALAAMPVPHILDEGELSQYARMCGGSFQETRLADKRISLDESVTRWARIDPQDFVKSAKSTEVILAAVGRRLELWNPELFEQQIAQAVQAPAGVMLPAQVLTPIEAQDAARGSTERLS